MAAHPDLEAEQAYIDHAYACLEATREAASRMTNLVEVGRGGTEQARFERDVIWDTMLQRLAQLDLGEAALCFGRIDFAPHAQSNNGNGNGDGAHGSDAYYIGRIAVSDENQEPVIVDWRAPVAEAFYRATGREPMGLERRRHFATRGRTLLGIEDELFGDAVEALGLDGDGAPRVSGHGALMSALETARTGRLGDIVALRRADSAIGALVIERATPPRVVLLNGFLGVVGGVGRRGPVVAIGADFGVHEEPVEQPESLRQRMVIG